MNKGIFLSSLFILLCICQHATAQVTIGSTEKPVDGALLQLKDKIGVTDGSDNANRGLNLPRVKLTNKNALLPMYANLADATNSVNMEAHIGLIVYNINECLPNGQTGIHVWVDKEWILLDIDWSSSEEIFIQAMGTPIDVAAANGLAWHKDQDGNVFYSSDFGTAGRWMVVNLRATKYDPIRTGGSIAAGKFPLKPYVFDGKYRPYYQYPKDSQAELDADPRWGLSYSWAAASVEKLLSKNPATNEQGKSEILQAVCPAKWYVPSDMDWTKLENEIITNTTQYANVAANIVSPLVGATDTDPYRGLSRGSHSQAMMSPCYVTGVGQSNMLNPYTKVGFNAYTGATNSGIYYWSSSYGREISDTYGGWVRAFARDPSTNTVWKNNHNVVDRMHIRCMRDPGYPLPTQ